MLIRKFIFAILVASVITKGIFIRYSNIEGLLSKGCILGVTALGLTFVIVSGEIDLSIGALFGLDIAVMSLFIRKGIM